ncbi:hypothetical protein I4U23_031450 [Adineta vaga]|nr:hypothetical protein I4U23_031450 [Adineta vaga]
MSLLLLRQQICIDYQLIIDTIWNLLTLRHCSLLLPHSDFDKVHIPKKVSLTLQSQQLIGYHLSLSHTDQFLTYTPNLKHSSKLVNIFRIAVSHNYVLPSLSTLISLDISIFHRHKLSIMNLFLKNLSNLRYLKIILFQSVINGKKFFVINFRN